jgi:hypothetical protein
MAQHELLETWTARYKADTLEIHESLRHQIWITSHEVRKVLPALRSDKILIKECSPTFAS